MKDEPALGYRPVALAAEQEQFQLLTMGDRVNKTIVIQNLEIRFAAVAPAATVKEVREQRLQVPGVTYAA